MTKILGDCVWTKTGTKVIDKENKGVLVGLSVPTWRIKIIMPRNSDRIKRSKPNVDNITAAAEAVLKDEVLVRIAVRQFGVSRTTL
ncbi:hypothetical protein TNCT_269281 [Trichonephila clavata]|uniref:Uncharacterized protein n=1 Tax=Trichonephila clavata TaxID=2740835 RepID=A0A8X6I1M9_TRICU|nr:hypothetical protein TNCT_269281 [Trichonephila clavata]